MVKIFLKSSQIRNFQEIVNTKLQICDSDSELGGRRQGGFTVNQIAFLTCELVISSLFLNIFAVIFPIFHEPQVHELRRRRAESTEAMLGVDCWAVGRTFGINNILLRLQLYLLQLDDDGIVFQQGWRKGEGTRPRY